MINGLLSTLGGVPPSSFPQERCYLHRGRTYLRASIYTCPHVYVRTVKRLLTRVPDFQSKFNFSYTPMRIFDYIVWVRLTMLDPCLRYNGDHQKG